MSELRKSKLASAMLCTLLFGGNAAGAMKKDMSKGILSDKLKDNLSKGQTENKELENRKPDDSSNPLLKYFLYFLGGAASVAKLADEGVGIAEAKDYIGYSESKKLSPLGKLSLYKFAMDKYYKTKTIGTMRNLVAELYKNAEGIKQVFDGITEFLTQSPQGTKKVEGKDNIFDVACGDDSVDIKGIYDNIEANFEFESLSNYVKAVLGVSVEQCDKILVNVCDNEQYRYIAFVKGNVCLKLTGDKWKIHFTLCGMKNGLPEDRCDGYSLYLDWRDYSLNLDSCYSVTRLYMGHILGIKDVGVYSFYDPIFARVYGEFHQCKNEADEIFPELFKKELKRIDE